MVQAFDLLGGEVANDRERFCLVIAGHFIPVPALPGNFLGHFYPIGHSGGDMAAQKTTSTMKKTCVVPKCLFVALVAALAGLGLTACQKSDEQPTKSDQPTKSEQPKKSEHPEHPK